MLTVSAVWHIPAHLKPHSLLAHVLGGWELDPIEQWHTGFLWGHRSSANRSKRAATASTCTAVLTCYGSGGTVLKTSTVTVAPETAGYLDLFSSTDLSLAVDQRKQIRATFAVPLVPNTTSTGSSSAASTTTTPPADVPACRLIATLEILDAVTGRTQVIVSGTHETASDITPVATGSN